MRICLLTNQNLDSPEEMEEDWPADPRPYLPDAEWDLLVLEKETGVRQVMTAALKDYDLFFNLCDGAWDEETPGIEIVITLERLGVPFTGADSVFYEPTRETMKRVCRAWDIETPAYAFVRTVEDVDQAARDLEFPLFVKHPSSYASIGLTRDSRVETVEALHEQTGIMIREYGGALIEEFIEGTEYTVLVAENAENPDQPIAYQSVEYEFPGDETFKHSDMKWVEYEKMVTVPVADPVLDRRLRQAASRFFRGLQGVGYGRCDVRVDADGRIFMLEINANCGLFFTEEDAGSADFCLLNDPRGHEGFTRAIVDAAFARHRHAQKNWRVKPRNGGYALFATRDIARGERIMVFEAETHTLVTLSHIESHWGVEERRWFQTYAWPLTDELWVTWSRDPQEWMPVNHACEPTAWFEGLDVVARTAIRAGEEITLDYATFYNERMPDFECGCAAAECRGTIRGTDLLEPFVERYGTHVSDYVRRRRSLEIPAPALQ